MWPFFGMPPRVDVDEKELVAAVLRKDRKATAEFVDRYADILYAYIRHRMLPRTDLVEDLVQDVFLAAWEGLPTYRAEASLAGWLLGIARHRVEDHYRRRVRELASLEENSEEIVDSRAELKLDQELDRERLSREAQRVLAGLPEVYSIALLWRYWEKRSTREIAIETGRTEKAVERILARARALFRERWSHGQPVG